MDHCLICAEQVASLCSSLSSTDVGFILVIDRRQDRWAAVKGTLLRIAVSWSLCMYMWPCTYFLSVLLTSLCLRGRETALFNHLLKWEDPVLRGAGIGERFVKPEGGVRASQFLSHSSTTNITTTPGGWHEPTPSLNSLPSPSRSAMCFHSYRGK